MCRRPESVSEFHLPAGQQPATYSQSDKIGFLDQNNVCVILAHSKFTPKIESLWQVLKIGVHRHTLSNITTWLLY